MNSKIIIAFCAGAAIGFAASYKLNEAKFKKIAQDEIDDVKEKFSLSRPKPVVDLKEELKDEPKPEVNEEEYEEYDRLAAKYADNEEKGGGMMNPLAPYVIEPDEYGELDDYETINLTYYEDGVLAYDMDDESIDDIEDVVGYECLNHFGDHDGAPDTVYVRNDVRRCDYEISLSARNYTDIVDGVLDPQDDEE